MGSTVASFFAPAEHAMVQCHASLSDYCFRSIRLQTDYYLCLTCSALHIKPVTRPSDLV